MAVPILPKFDPGRAARGSIAGKISAARLTPEQRSARSTIAGNSTLSRYGVGYFSALGRLSNRKRKQV